MKSKKTKIVALTTVLLCSAAVTAWFIYPSSWVRGAEKALQSFGFNHAKVGSYSFQKNGILFEDIALDPNKFSTIESITIPVSPKGLITMQDFDKVVIDNIKIAGEISDKGTVEIEKWSPPAIAASPYSKIIVNSALLDLFTPAGALRFEAKGQLENTDGESSKIKGVLWGRQHQLRLDTKWSGSITNKENWALEAEIDEAALNFDNIQSSRVTGWLSLEAPVKDKRLPKISGQIDAGKLNVGSIPLNNASLTINAQKTGQQYIISGTYMAQKPAFITIDITEDYESGWDINATASTTTLESLLEFLKMLQNSSSEMPLHSDLFTSFLITPGNLDRISKTIKKLDYTKLELKLEGPPYDLNGKIIVKTFKNNAVKQNVISLNPTFTD